MEKTEAAPRKVIGVFTAELSEAYQSAVWRGIQEKAEEQGFGLIAFLGSRYNSPFLPEATANGIYSLAGPENVDGLVIISSAIFTYLDPPGIRELFHRRRDIPQVSVGVRVPGYSSILVDGYQGMAGLTEHLVTEHRRRKFALIAGPPGHEEGEVRKQAVIRMLESRGIPLDPELVESGTFEQESGAAAAARLASRGKPFDALICLNDLMALGALEELRGRGIRIPEDLSLAGFDDIEEARYCTPPLTTVMQPLYEVGAQAVLELIRLMEGEPPRERTLSCEPVIRESCGCPLRLIPRRGEAGEVSARSGEEEFRELLEIARRGDSPEFIARLNGALTSDLLGRRNLNRWYDSIIRISRILEEEAGAEFSREAPRGELLQEALVLIGRAQTRLQAARRLDSERRSSLARMIGISLAEAFEVPVMLDRFCQGLRLLGFRQALLAVFETRGAPGGEARLLISPDEPDRPVSRGRTFPSRQLIPGYIDPSWKQGHWVLKPLVFQSEFLGYLLLPADGTRLPVYDTLSKQLATTLKGALLLEQVRSHERSLEETVARRTTELTKTNEMLKQEIRRRIRLEQEVIEISNQTMDRIGQDLHDDLCQHLAGISMLATAFRNSLPSGDTAFLPFLEQINTLLVESIDRAKGIVRGLVSTEIREQGLAVLVEALVQAARKSYGLDIRLENRMLMDCPDKDQALQIYRIVQEALTNAVKHSRCTRVTVTLSCEPGSEDPDSAVPLLTAEVRDDGVGIPDTRSRTGMGLKIMQYRAEKAGAILTVERLDPGTRVFCEVPGRRGQS